MTGFARMYRRIRVNSRSLRTSLNLFALLCQKGKARLLDGIPSDDGKAAPETTPGGDSSPTQPPVPTPGTPTGPTVK